MNNMEWNELTDLAMAAYNFIPNVTSMEAPFFLMFGRDPYMPLNQLMAQARRYLSTEESTPGLEALQNLLQITTMQIQYAANRRNQNFKPMKAHDFKVGDLVLMRNHTSKAFQEKYQDSFHVTRLLGKNQLEVKDQNNHIRTVHIMDVKKTTMPEVILNAIPNYSQFGRAAKLRLNSNHFEDLGWTIPTEYQNIKMELTQEISSVSTTSPKTKSQETQKGMSTQARHQIYLGSGWSLTCSRQD